MLIVLAFIANATKAPDFLLAPTTKSFFASRKFDLFASKNSKPLYVQSLACSLIASYKQQKKHDQSIFSFNGPIKSLLLNNNNHNYLVCSNVNQYRFFNTNLTDNRDMNETSTSTSASSPSTTAVSRLKIQSPPPLATADGDNPITQVQQVIPPEQKRKSRQHGFLSQLWCCFRPATYNGICIRQNHYCYSYRGDSKSRKNIYNQHNNATQDQIQSQNHNSAPKYSGKSLLPPKVKGDDRICMVIDLDETLVHSSFKPIESADFVVPVEIDGTPHKVHVLKRPHVDEFLEKMGQLYECVLFTASLAKYADPVADWLDKENKVFKARLFRESCAFYRGNYVKDLSRLGRDLNRVIIVDNSPASYIFHPQNAVPVQSWFDDLHDTELLDLIPFLEGLSSAQSVYGPLGETRHIR